ncbi:MAG: M3 family metallopeptidase [Prevotella sp.]|nr:M3 family metallopeptidase [Prevotellaceae bacterium]MDY5343105.1 M3 family metallopeptidase [Prevotella sp.]
MRKTIITTCAAAIVCGSAMAKGGNPFLGKYTTPYGIPPFEQIKVEHYKPAFIKGMEEHKKEIDAIVNNKKTATFENTIAALDRCGELLNKVASVFYGQNSACTSDEMQAVSREISPLLSQHSDDITMNAALFKRVKYVYDHQSEEKLDKEQKKLLEETYKSFVRSGANLSADKQEQLRKLNQEISMLQLTFGQNMLAETNAFQLVIDNKDDLAGLPQNLIASAAEVAKERGLDGNWVFTLHNPSVMPFLQYSDRRELRERMYKGYISRGCQGGKNDSREVVKKLVKARLEKARLMGYEDYASMALDNRMAKTPEAVYELLDQVWKPALAKAKEELADIQEEMKKDGRDFTAEGWDWRYYADRAKRAKYAFDENELRPYLKLENVRDGLFYCANKLYGITLTPIKNVPLPHPEAQAFEVKDAKGKHIAILFMDFFPRASKRGGAWCGTYRDQTYEKGKKITPVVTIVCNFTKPAAGEPALLTADEASTMFHEFGHALHQFFQDVHYQGISNVPRDFVELPSQINEHWCFAPEVLKVYAKHYKTGEIMPQSLVEKMERSQKYGQGFATVEYVAASLLDMDWHVLKSVPDDLDVEDFERQTLVKRGLLSQIPPRYRTTYFNHTMGGGYTAGYYSYMWAEVLEADGFEAFKETGDIFNQDVANRFRTYVLTPGGINDAMDMYVNFRGKKPDTKPLLRNRGLLE